VLSPSNNSVIVFLRPTNISLPIRVSISCIIAPTRSQVLLQYYTHNYMDKTQHNRSKASQNHFLYFFLM
jgi:hypothetical protein